MISTNVHILTNEELEAIKRAAYRRGVERGRFEEGMDRAERAKNEKEKA